MRRVRFLAKPLGWWQKALESVILGIKTCHYLQIYKRLMSLNLCFLTGKLEIITPITLSGPFVKIKWDSICEALGPRSINVHLPLTKVYLFVNHLLERAECYCKDFTLVIKLSFLLGLDIEKKVRWEGIPWFYICRSLECFWWSCIPFPIMIIPKLLKKVNNF